MTTGLTTAAVRAMQALGSDQSGRADQIADRLAEAIRLGLLVPGERLPAEAVLADQLGVDVIALGEHHRPEYSISTPETLLAGIATRTSRIKLASGVTVLSSDDPVRVFQRFATVDALSNGRAEVILGRGSFTESFPLFGYDLNDYDDLFEEKLQELLAIRQGGKVNWPGSPHT
ncbi:MAG TPA: LLM class flavin-dependent oxidoreductase, partial [Pseudonocardiaceae bacterium]|nr:LLM class flavin-dependent oxidoreductase [Pseudonocardiaceae bacterium]